MNLATVPTSAANMNMHRSEQSHLNLVLRAWKKCPASSRWPTSVDQVLFTTWQGSEIAWLFFEDECFEIFRVNDSTEISEEELPSGDAYELNWAEFKFLPPLAC